MSMVQKFKSFSGDAVIFTLNGNNSTLRIDGRTFRYSTESSIRGLSRMVRTNTLRLLCVELLISRTVGKAKNHDGRNFDCMVSSTGRSQQDEVFTSR